MKIQSFKNYLQSDGKTKSTVTHYTSYILDFISWLDQDNTEVENVTAKEVLGYMSHLQKKGLENKTRNIRLNVIKQFFSWQITQGHRADNPITHLKIRGTKRYKLHHILSLQELDSIYTNYVVPAQEDPRSNRNWFRNYKLSKSRNKAVISLMVNQGLTTAELEKLSLGDLRLKEGKLYVCGSRRSNERTLELKSSQIIELMEYQYTTRAELLSYQQQPTHQLFLPTPIAGQKKANAQTLQIWKGLTSDLRGQQEGFINFKQIRASVITHWLKKYNLREAQYMAGHRYVSSTESYLVNQTEDLQADIDQFHPF